MWFHRTLSKRFPKEIMILGIKLLDLRLLRKEVEDREIIEFQFGRYFVLGIGADHSQKIETCM